MRRSGSRGAGKLAKLDGQIAVPESKRHALQLKRLRRELEEVAARYR